MTGEITRNFKLFFVEKILLEMKWSIANFAGSFEIYLIAHPSKRIQTPSVFGKSNENFRCQ